MSALLVFKILALINAVTFVFILLIVFQPPRFLAPGAALFFAGL